MKSLIEDLDDSCLRYLEIRTQYLKLQMDGSDLREIEDRRTAAHNALIANFNAVLRNLEPKPKDMIDAAQAGRIAVGNWGLKRALTLIQGADKPGTL